MKKAIVFGMLGILFSLGLYAQNQNVDAIKSTVTKFVKAGDNNDVAAIERCLDANYQVVMNRLFGAKTLSIMPKPVYLDKIAKKELGGDTRKVTFEEIVLNGSSAVAKVKMVGTKLSFVSLINLVQDEQGSWKLICEIPTLL